MSSRTGIQAALTAALALAMGACGGGGSQPAPPTATTLPADGVGYTGATLHAVVTSPSATTAWFEWGPDLLSGGATSAPVAVAAGATSTPLSLVLDGLDPGVTYSFRVVAAQGGTAVRGAQLWFSTAAPLVHTAGPDGIGETVATIHGQVTVGGEAGLAWFEWGTEPSLAAALETPRVPVPAGGAARATSATLGELEPGATYYYRAVASVGGRTNRGAVDFFGTTPPGTAALVVNSTADVDPPPPGKLTLREALARLDPGGTITFAPALDGQVIALSLVGQPHSLLKGEVYTFAAGAFTFQGFLARDYGRSALYAAKALTIDASALPHGVTLAWSGGEASPARVLAVLGDLTLDNVTVRGGHALAEPLADPAQPFTLGRGGGLAVWGQATLRRCTVAGNRASGDLLASRDRGAFGGGLYADSVVLEDSVVGGNAARGFGAAGGGIYSVGGVETGATWLSRSSVTGNRVTGQHAYGGGVYSDGGGPGNMMGLDLLGCTVAGNVVEDHPDVAEDARAQYYYRGGGVYLSNGWLAATACTITGNVVTGVPAVFRGKPNMGGGGVGATIGDAHVVESMQLRQSIVVGNTRGGAADDLFTGSLVNFHSEGFNLVGRLDFSQMLVPAPWWGTLSRRHWPKPGDQDRVEAAAVLDLAAPALAPDVTSAGVDPGAPVVLWYRPVGLAVDRIPVYPYEVSTTTADYTQVGPTDDFLAQVLAQVRARYGDQLGADFGASLPDPTGVTFHGPGVTWPSNPENAAWIAFWRGLEEAIGDRLGAVQLGDFFWASLPAGPFGPNVETTSTTWTSGVFGATDVDQVGTSRPAGGGPDVGAIERLP
ncbi:MAG: hypothetical protein IPO09_09920 [Anaeromyxobacter sp.]|nr:hypothetical protein [Anaeromyxobacter sp.]